MCSEVVAAQGFRVHAVGADERVNFRGVEVRLGFHTLEVDRRSCTTNGPVRVGRKRGLVNDAVPQHLVEFLISTPLIRENMMDVGSQCRVLNLVE